MQQYTIAIYDDTMNLLRLRGLCKTAIRKGTGYILHHTQTAIGDDISISPCTGARVAVVIWEVNYNDFMQIDLEYGYPLISGRYYVDVAYYNEVIHCLAYYIQSQCIEALPKKWTDYFIHSQTLQNQTG